MRIWFDEVTGLPVRWVYRADPETPEEGGLYRDVEVSFEDTLAQGTLPPFYLDPDGIVQPMSQERPALGCDFDRVTGTWSAQPPLAYQAEGIVLTDIQFAMACASAGLMTAAESEAWVARGEIPALALAAIAGIADPAAQAMARIRFSGARDIARHDPFIPLLQASAGLTDDQVDQLFIAARGL